MIKPHSILLILLLLFSACNREEINQLENIIVFNNQEYEIAKAFLTPYEETEDGIYSLALSLFSTGFEFHPRENSIDSVSGDGTLVLLLAYSSQPYGIIPGIYQFSSSDIPILNTFSTGLLVSDNEIKPEIIMQEEIISGILSVEKQDTIYSIMFDGFIEDGDSLSFYYKGPILYFDL